MKKEITYLCIPYTWNPELSFKIANIVASTLILHDYIVFSPISHSHPIEAASDKKLMLKHNIWMEQDLALLSKCDSITVCHIEGIENKSSDDLLNESKGCQLEIAYAKQTKMLTRTYNIDVSSLKETSTKEHGERFNTGKVKWSLVDFSSFEPMVKVLEFGAKKYSRFNWQKGLNITEICESLLRHTFAFLKGENNDKESKISHIGHIQCNSMFLSYMFNNKKEFDDRENTTN